MTFFLFIVFSPVFRMNYKLEIRLPGSRKGRVRKIITSGRKKVPVYDRPASTNCSARRDLEAKKLIRIYFSGAEEKNWNSGFA